MIDAPLLLALTAGMVGAINPCGFSLLPAYVGFFVSGGDGEPGLDRRLVRAIASSAAVTLGFVVVFVVLGTILSSVTSRIQRQLPWVTIIVGIVLLVAGLAVLTGRRLPAPALVLRAVKGRGPVAMVSYGVVYALASLSCTIGPFLAITSAALGKSFVGGLATYASYAVGMGLIILAIASCAALVRPRPVAELRKFTRYSTRAGGILMVLSGAYAIWYARWELAVYGGDLRTSGIVEFGERWRLAAVDWIDRVGADVLAAVIVGAVALGFAVSQLVADSKHARASDSDPG